MRWLNEKATEGRVKLGELREGLGRLQFIAGAIEYLRPFLGPLYAWAAAGPRFARPKLPIMVVLILKYLAKELEDFHAMPCQKRANFLGEVFRLDAKAEGDTVAVGGWRSANGAKGGGRKVVFGIAHQSHCPMGIRQGRALQSHRVLGVVSILDRLDGVGPGGRGGGRDFGDPHAVVRDRQSRQRPLA